MTSLTSLGTLSLMTLLRAKASKHVSSCGLSTVPCLKEVLGSGHVSLH